ncbi:hypothetical protein K458DRAFT_395201 [Lentithecium fluviatile CBS 122367]|uniref:Uncharacterized protein n=1 Tax=Lentithecium fluviatile CBS 122367 TaxID=1168545 RepID=A0A6G1IJL0_9PLEO|nr:hypothetical protein K458DRAFT_395201 [Lentithecium fluviatile CBS 122367]
MNANKGGRHEGLITTTDKCYNLGNGWNNEISSLEVPSGFGCIFYEDNDYNPNDKRLTVTGHYYVANLANAVGGIVFNIIISSYLCCN